MDTDLLPVIGITLSGLAIPPLLAAYSESRPPRAGAIMILVGGILIVVALTQTIKSYTFAEIPDLFIKVISRFLN